MAYWLVEQMTLSREIRKTFQGLSSYHVFSSSLLGISPGETKLSTQNPVCDINGDVHKVEPSKDLSMNEWTRVYIVQCYLAAKRNEYMLQHTETLKNMLKNKQHSCLYRDSSRSTKWVPDWQSYISEFCLRNKTQHKAVYGSVCVLCLRWHTNRNKKSLGGCQAGGERKQ